MKNINEQLIEIETKIAFQDDSIEKLNTVIIKQQNQITNSKSFYFLYFLQTKNIKKKIKMK